MSVLATAPIRSLLEANYKAKQPETDAEVWCLNLDQVESHSGKVLSKLLVNAREVGPSTYAFEAGTVLYCKLRPYLNKVVVADADGVATTELVPLRCDPSKVLPDYLAHFLRSPAFLAFATNVVAGAKMPRMVMGEFWAFPVPLPPLEEQRRIAAILDQAETLRTQRRQALAHLDTLTQSLFLDMFGDPATNPKNWTCMRVGDTANKFSDGPFGSNLKSSHYTETGVRVIRLQNIGVGELIDKDKAYVSEEHFDKLRKHECLPGDVLIGTLGEPNLRACIQPLSLSRSLNKADCVQLRTNPEIANAAYLCALLNQPAVAEMAHDLMQGQTRVRISMGRLRGLAVPVPPLPLQQTFATRIAAIEALKATHRSALAQLDALFASLQQRAFAGEL